MVIEEFKIFREGIKNMRSRIIETLSLLLKFHMFYKYICVSVCVVGQ